MTLQQQNTNLHDTLQTELLDNEYMEKCWLHCTKILVFRQPSFRPLSIVVFSEYYIYIFRQVLSGTAAEICLGFFFPILKYPMMPVIWFVVLCVAHWWHVVMVKRRIGPSPNVTSLTAVTPVSNESSHFHVWHWLALHYSIASVNLSNSA